MRVYVAGPITKGNQFRNMGVAIEAAHALMDEGFYPFVPHLSCVMDIGKDRPYEEWLALDFEWISVCDAVLRLEGVSAGADREEEFALGLSIPVFHTIAALVKYREGRQSDGVS